MGHKVNPIGLRLGIIRTWDSHWYSDKDYTKLVQEDIAIRSLINDRVRDAAISRTEIDRSANNVIVTIHTARPGIIIGRSGARIEELRQGLEKLTGKRVRVNIHEIRHPETDATLVAKSISEQIQRRVAYRRAMKQSVLRAMQRGAKGIKVIISGRLGGAEMSRRERETEGKVPLHTLRADVDYGFAEALTTYGTIGIKVWVYHGEVLPVRRTEARPPVTAVASQAGSGEVQSNVDA